MLHVIHIVAAQEAVQHVLVCLEAVAERLASAASLPAPLLLAPLLLLLAPLVRRWLLR